MRKLLLTVATGLLSVSLFAQSAITSQPHDRAEMMAKFKNAKAVPYAPKSNMDLAGAPVDGAAFYKMGVRTGEAIGSTGYPLQSNGAAFNRVRVYDDGSMSAIFTGSTLTDGAWADRGMFYNHNDGASWGPAPTARVETVRAGFGDLVYCGDREIVASHDGTNIRVFGNSGVGNTDWTELGVSTLHAGLWPRAASAEGTDDLYLISANANPVTAITFSRSDDNGATWTVANYVLPFLDSINCINALSADAYQIGVYGSTVYVLYGTSWTDLVLLTSNSNGDPGTWTKTTVVSTGFCNYQGDLDQISDVTGDGIADTVETTDGWHEMVIDDAGNVHVWSGYYWLLDDDPATEGWSYFPSLYGQWYWNSTMAEASPMWIDLLVDWDDSGDPFDGIGADLGMYDGVTFTSMPCASYDAGAGRIYLAYTMPIEYTDYFDDPTIAEAQSFRDIFGTYSDDMGASWSAPVNMTYTAHENREASYVYAYDRFTGGCMHAIWHEDDEPGTALDQSQAAADANSIGDIKYRCFDEARFNPYPPTAEYEYTPDGTSGLVNFNNLSVDADDYSWDFGDGGSSTTENPAHVYAESGTYNVCLVATNKYDSDNTCKIIDISVGVVDYALGQALNVYPSPTATNVTINVDGNYGNLFAEVYNNLGERVINTTSFNTNVTFDVTALSAGTYIVKVATENGRYTSRQFTVSK